VRFENRRNIEMRSFATAHQRLFEDNGAAIVQDCVNHLFLYHKGRCRSIKNVILFETDIHRNMSVFDFIYVGRRHGTKQASWRNTCVLVHTHNQLVDMLVALERPLLTAAILSDVACYTDVTSLLNATARLVYVKTPTLCNTHTQHLHHIVKTICATDNLCIELHGNALLLWHADSYSPVAEIPSLVAIAELIATYANEHLRSS
jgi:hypothetical protein